MYMYIYVEIEDGTSLLEVFALHYRSFSTVYNFFVITCIIVLENVPLAPIWKTDSVILRGAITLHHDVSIISDLHHDVDF